MISMMVSALSLPAAGTATTISVVLNVTKNKEVESGLITRETRRLENLQRPSRWFGVGESSFLAQTNVREYPELLLFAIFDKSTVLFLAN